MRMQGILGTQRGNEIIATYPNKEDSEVRDVYFGMECLTSYREDDVEAKKILVGFLGNAGVRNTAVSRAMDINPCVVTRYAKQMKREGIAALLKDGRGRPSKVTDEIAVFVKKKYKKLKKNKKRNIRPNIEQKVKEKYGIEISRELIRQITIPLRAERSLLVRDEQNQTKESERKLLPVLRSTTLPEEINTGSNGKNLLKRLQTGFYSRYAGGLLLNVFIAKMTEGVLDGYKDSELAYDLMTFMIMIIQMVQFDTINIEQVKRITRREFGLLAGVNSVPSIITMRRKLDYAVKQLDIEKISTRLARNYISNLSSGTDVFYEDDHLEGYTGKNKVLMGFSHIYDRMLKGIQHTFVHDRWGNPIYFKLRDNFNTFKEFIPVMVKKIKRLYKGKKKPTFIFDRAGYDKKLFAEFDGGLGAYYIVWAKNDKTEYEKQSLKFDNVNFYFRRNIPGKPKKVTIGIVELPREKGKKQRKIVLRRKTTRRLKEKKKYMYSSLVTNNMRKPKEEIVEHIIYRWREECDFKVEKNEFGIDQITSYMMEDYTKDIFEEEKLLSHEICQEKMMQNPMLKPLRYRKGKIKRQIAKIDGQIGKWTFNETKKKERTIAEASELKRNKDALCRRKHLHKQLEGIEKKIDSLPKQVNRLECLIYNKIKRFDFSKKLIMDTLKVCARNVRKMALEVLDHHYKNYRDQLDFLRRIIKNGGHIKLSKQGMVVVDIVPFDTEAENKVLSNFLKEINLRKPRMFTNNPLPIKFRVKNG